MHFEAMSEKGPHTLCGGEGLRTANFALVNCKTCVEMVEAPHGSSESRVLRDLAHRLRSDPSPTDRDRAAKVLETLAQHLEGGAHSCCMKKTTS